MRGLYAGTLFAAATDDATAAGLVVGGAVGGGRPAGALAPLRRSAGVGIATCPLFTTVHSLRERKRLSLPLLEAVY